MARRTSAITFEEFINNFSNEIKEAMVKVESPEEDITNFKLNGTKIIGKLYRNGPLDFYRINISPYAQNKDLFEDIAIQHWIDEGEDGNIYIREIYRPSNPDFKLRMERLNNTLQSLKRFEEEK